jgi:hypothetical protein
VIDTPQMDHASDSYAKNPSVGGAKPTQETTQEITYRIIRSYRAARNPLSRNPRRPKLIKRKNLKKVICRRNSTQTNVILRSQNRRSQT